MADTVQPQDGHVSEVEVVQKIDLGNSDSEENVPLFQRKEYLDLQKKEEAEQRQKRFTKKEPKAQASKPIY